MMKVRALQPSTAFFLMVVAALVVTAPNTPSAKTERPVALVESIDGAKTDVQAFDYVFENDKIDLRPGGHLVLAYFDRCIVETFTGGVVKIKSDGAEVSSDGQSARKIRACGHTQVVLDEDAAEVGAAVKRVSPFESAIWKEQALASAKPIFKWQQSGQAAGVTALKVYYLDDAPIRLVWQGSVSGSYFEFPSEGLAFETGMPYRVEAVLADGKVVAAVFSIDPDLDVADDVMSRLVTLD